MLHVTSVDDTANFSATVNTEEDLVEMLLVVLSYVPKERKKETTPQNPERQTGTPAQ